MAETPSYNRLPDETAKAYEAFSVYRDMGMERTKEAVSEKLSKSGTLIRRWASKYNWDDRVLDWDAEQDLLRQKEAIAARRKEHRENLKQFGQNHAQLGKQAFKAAALGTQALVRFMEKNPEVESIAEGAQLAGIVKTIIPIADFWAKGLAVDRLLEKLGIDNDDDD